MIHGYARCSTHEQASNGKTTIADQETRIRGAAMMRGVENDAVTMYADVGVSGGMPLEKRPLGREMVKRLRRGDTVIAAKLDRLFRSASDALTTVEKLKAHGIDVILADIGPDPVTENGSSKLFFSMLAAFAEFERTRIAERMSEGRRGKVRRGGHIGGDAPYGYRVVGEGAEAKLEKEPAELAVIDRMAQLRMTGVPYRRIGKVLAAEGMLSRIGQPFTHERIQRILARASKLPGA